MIAITQARDKAKAQAGMQPADAPCDIAEKMPTFQLMSTVRMKLFPTVAKVETCSLYILRTLGIMTLIL